MNIREHALLSFLASLALVVSVVAQTSTEDQAEPQSVTGGEVSLLLDTGETEEPGYDWVAAEAAFDNGGIHWELFSNEAQARVRALLRTAEDPTPDDPWSHTSDECSATSRVFIPPRNDRRAYAPLDALVNTSRTVLLARVISERPGFHHGILKTLYAVEPLEVFKEDGVDQADSILFLYPYARVSYKGMILCGTGPRFPDHPQIGDRVLLFISRSVSLHRSLLLLPDNGEILFSGAGRRLSAPRSFQQPEEEGDQLLEDILRSLRSIVEPAADGKAPDRLEGATL